MARTKRNIPYKHYWGSSKEEKRRRRDEAEPGTWYYEYYDRAYKLHGTDVGNFTFPTHYYFNRVNRIGRRVARDQLRPHIVLGENYDYDDSHYRARWKGVWWDIY